MWPQPTDDPLDPQNWSGRKKDWHLVIIALATIVPDFDSAIGIASVFPLAIQYHTTTGRINNLTTKSLDGTIKARVESCQWQVISHDRSFNTINTNRTVQILMNRYGRLPVLFWTQVNITHRMFLNDLVEHKYVGYAMRCLSAFFGTAPQVTSHPDKKRDGIGPIHHQRHVFLPPASAQARDLDYGICNVATLVSVFLRLPCRPCELALGLWDRMMYDRRGIRKVMSTGVFRSRFESLVGITGWKTSSLGPTWKELVMRLLRLVWRPHFVGVYIFEAMSFGFANGVNLTNTIVLQSAPPFGFGLDQISVAGIYAAPVIAVFIGEILGRYFNDWNMYYCVRHNDGVFEAESRLRHVFLEALASRFFQIPWSNKSGALQTLGVEAAIVCGLFLLVVPFLQYKGDVIRRRFAI
ncbi:hypothetical protein BDP27DRAFT_1366786 [Rhodocollybia butyracea]|uniref:Uncharacterized protein n=1 Tax=Rhodocollybia butyracea TaxID=206335 RepID=A0A9P5PJD6_9AGAR|nr:hypothetical protein BDP27DRAFT_1366786 [Rhodocollybia butyracea]